MEMMRKNEGGMALSWVLAVLMFCLILVTLALFLTSAGHKREVAEIKRQQAFFTARSVAGTLAAEFLNNDPTGGADIHIEPHEHETVIRMRRDGMLLPYMTLPLTIHQGLVARTKILAQMDIAEKRRPQDGHFKINLDNRELNIRVSFVPTLYGEKGV